MRLKKYQHACVAIEEGEETLVIDPGVFSSAFSPEDNIVGVVITHMHSDHIDPDKIEAILQLNSEAKIFSTEEVASAYPNLPIQVARPNEQIKAGSFMLSFTGGQHATISPDMPVNQNIGIRINGTIYYPGDSFALPNTKVKNVLVPAAAPWMKISEAMEFIANVGAEQVIPTHDAILSDEGKQIHDGMLSQATTTHGGTYRRLEVGETIEI